MTKNTFIPAWYKIDSEMRRWSLTNLSPEQHEDDETDNQRWTAVWFHDESTFYAHNCCKMCWVLRDAKALPQQKGEGPSLMVANFISADYGWLCSCDGKESTWVLFRVGKGHDGYFTNDEILEQTKKAMTILEEDCPDEDHVFVFDNATTHLKCADDALSAHCMPKSCHPWGVEINVKDVEGKLVYGAHGKPMKQKIPMGNGTFADGSPHKFCHPPGHKDAGFFKGMATILTEQGFDTLGLKAQCHNSKAFDCVTCRKLV
ncbi:hypothetical protein PAXRUDRAFT_769013 [Paxillus rubicundulus Ve08.2h10]|uniref:DDE-1 domain-containing protein n=1 Tax=Paxillus rubicundulus Ve08.2h10 TaxID=930991 RepID=A0A0D0E0I2_9AGAM|nr:hypothetical protein PAXRUDRAFT_769013 [Paxillus rubicundulus Ve08.2h10]